MKTLYTFIFIAIISFTVNAQAPQKFNYQAVARDAAGNVLPNQNVSYDIAIRKGSLTGSIVYEETHNVNTNIYGLVTLSIGAGNVSSGSMSTIVWNNGPYFIEVNIDPIGGSNYTLSSVQELMSVPFALYAQSAPTDTMKADKVLAAGVDNITVLNASGNLVDGGKKLDDYLAKDNLTAYSPTTANNPATKGYVDDANALKAEKVIGATSGNFAALDATGNLVDGGKNLNDYLAKDNTTLYIPSSNYNPATKMYVDDADSLKVDKVLSATATDIAVLDASGNLVDGGKNLNDYLAKDNTTSYSPSANYNPATKKYVDDAAAAALNSATSSITYSMPVTLSTTLSTTSTTFINSNLYVLIPGPPPGKTNCRVKITVDYSTSNVSTTGELALLNYTNYTGGAFTGISGSNYNLPATNGVWTAVETPQFTASTMKTVSLVFRRTAGTGNVQIEGITYTLTFD